jgi:hypothetical protein
MDVLTTRPRLDTLYSDITLQIALFLSIDDLISLALVSMCPSVISGSLSESCRAARPCTRSSVVLAHRNTGRSTCLPLFYLSSKMLTRLVIPKPAGIPFGACRLFARHGRVRQIFNREIASKSSRAIGTFIFPGRVGCLLSRHPTRRHTCVALT